MWFSEVQDQGEFGNDLKEKTIITNDSLIQRSILTPASLNEGNDGEHQQSDRSQKKKGPLKGLPSKGRNEKLSLRMQQTNIVYKTIN